MCRFVHSTFAFMMALGVALLAGSAGAQEPKTQIRGTVLGTTGHALPGVTVTAEGQTTLTDADGKFLIEIEATSSRQQVEVRAFRQEHQTAQTRSTITISPGESITVNLVLQPYFEEEMRERVMDVPKSARGHISGGGRATAAPLPPPPPPPSPAPSAPTTAEAPTFSTVPSASLPPAVLPSTSQMPAKSSLDKAVVRIFYATDRKVSLFKTTNGFYTGARRTDDGTDLGTCDVSIPSNHRLGEMERPSILRFEFNERRGRDVVLLNVRPVPEASFYAALHDRLSADPGKELLVFVHGFNVDFAEAARRTAQITYDLDFRGAPVLYSWPSQGKLQAYTQDEAAVDESRWHFQRFLARLAAQSGADRIYVIAHSMGSRVVARSVESLVDNRSLQSLPAFREVILAAPDIDSGELRQLAAALHTAAVRVTVYINSKDLAITASRKVHGAARAGDGSAEIFLAEGIDTVDATDTDTSFLHHSYYANSTLLTDIHSLLLSDSPPPRQGMERALNASGVFWRFHLPTP